MSRLYKVFVAPGPEDAALPGASTPWRYPRQVRLPMEHWERMLTLLDGDDFALLDGLPGTDDETARPSPALRATLLRLVERLATAPPLTPDDVDDPEIPEPMPPRSTSRCCATSWSSWTRPSGSASPSRCGRIDFWSCL